MELGLLTETADLPEEIINLIFNFAHGPTRKLLRSTCKKWHKKLFDNYFTFYFTNKINIQSIVEHISVHYADIPIGVQFKKSVDREIRDYTQHLAKLTNLTSLSLDRPVAGIDDNEWLRLTTLTNLIYFEQCPMTLQHIFTQLRSFNYSKIKIGAFEYWPKFTNLETFRISCTAGRNLDPIRFISNPTRLTALIVKSNSVTTADVDHAKLFTNLKKLECYNNSIANEDFNIELFTSLEHLKIRNTNYEKIDSLIHLTKLALASDEYFNMEHMSALTKLKRLRLFDMFEVKEDQLKFLADLTALEQLTVDARGLTGEFFQWIDRTNLTQLHCWYSGNQPNHFKFLTNLRRLDLEGCNREFNLSYDYISYLTALTRFTIDSRHNSIPFLSPFTNLKHLSVPSLYTASTLPNLESLHCEDLSETVIDELRLLTKLTSLKSYFDSQNENITILSKLPLREFFNRAKVSTTEFFSELSRMTALERLRIKKIDDFSILRDLTRLTYLQVVDLHNVKVDNLTLLTSLQMVIMNIHLPREITQHLTRLYNISMY